MKLGAISVKYKEKKSVLKVTIYHDYFIKNKSNSGVCQKKTVVSIKKPTKRELDNKLK